jgi:hypothetical protein
LINCRRLVGIEKNSSHPFGFPLKMKRLGIAKPLQKIGLSPKFSKS